MSLVLSGDHTVTLTVGGNEIVISRNGDYSQVFDRDSIASVCDIHEIFETNKGRYQRKTIEGIGNVSGVDYKHYYDDRCNCILCWIHKKKITPFSLPTNDAKIECVADQLREMRLHRHMPFSHFRVLVDNILPSGSVIAKSELMKELYNNIWFRIFDSAPLKKPIHLMSFLDDSGSGTADDTSTMILVRRMQKEENERFEIEQQRFHLYKHIKAGTIRDRHTRLIERALTGPVLVLSELDTVDTAQLSTLRRIKERFTTMNAFFKQKFRCEYVLRDNEVDNELLTEIERLESNSTYHYLDANCVRDVTELYTVVYDQLQSYVDEPTRLLFEKFINDQVSPMDQEYAKELCNYKFEYYRQITMSILGAAGRSSFHKTLRDTLDVIDDEYSLALAIQHSNLKPPRAKIIYLKEYREQSGANEDAGIQILERLRRTRNKKQFKRKWYSADDFEDVEITEERELSDTDLWLKEKKSLDVKDQNIVTGIFRLLPPADKKWMLAYDLFKKLGKKRDKLDEFALRMVKDPESRNMPEFRKVLGEQLDTKMQLSSDKITEKMQVVFEWLDEDDKRQVIRKWNRYKYEQMQGFMLKNRINKNFNDDKWYVKFLNEFRGRFANKSDQKKKYNEKGGYREQKKMEVWFNNMSERNKGKWNEWWKKTEKKILPKFNVDKASKILKENGRVQEVEKFKEQLSSEFKFDLSIRLDTQYEAFKSFSGVRGGTLTKFLLENLPPQDKEKFKETLNEYTKNSNEIQKSMGHNTGVLERNQNQFNEEQKAKFQAAVSRDNGYLKQCKNTFETKKMKFKNYVFNRLIERKFTDMFIKSQMTYAGADFWSTRNRYKDNLLIPGTRIFALDVSELLSNWNNTTFKVGNVSDRGVNAFLMSFLSTNDFKNYQQFKHILAEYNRCGRDLLENLSIIEKMILKVIGDDTGETVLGDVERMNSIAISEFALEINPDYRINVEEKYDNDDNDMEGSNIKSMSKLGVEFDTDYTFFQLTPEVKNRMNSIRTLINNYTLDSEIKILFEETTNKYETCLSMFHHERDYLKLMTLPKVEVFDEDNMAKAWVVSKRGKLVTIDIEKTVKVEEEITHKSTIYRVSKDVTTVERRILHMDLCFPIMQDFEWLRLQIDLEKYNEATDESQEIREMERIERQKQEIARSIEFMDSLDESQEREEVAEVERIERVRNDTVAQDLLFEEWAMELKSADNGGQYITNKKKHCENNPHEADMFIAARRRWVLRIQKRYTRASSRPSNVQMKFTLTSALQNKLRSYDAIRTSNLETAFYRRLMFFLDDDGITEHLYAFVNDKIELNEKLEELKRMKSDFDNAIIRYDEVLRRKGRTIRQKQIDKRTRIQLEFEKIEKQLKDENFGGLQDASPELLSYYRFAMPNEMETILYTPQGAYSETEWVADVERSYQPLDSYIWGQLKDHVTKRDRKVPNGTRTRTVTESDFDQMFVIVKNKQRYLPTVKEVLLFEVDKIEPPIKDLSTLVNPIRLAWGPGSWFDIDLSCDLMRHTGLSLSTRRRIQEQLEKQIIIEKAAYETAFPKIPKNKEWNKTVTKYALDSVTRQLTREQAGKEICDAFDTFKESRANLGTPDDWKSDEEKYKIRTYEWIEDKWSKKIKNWKDDGKNIRLLDDIIDRTTGIEVTPTHMRLHHFYLESLEQRRKITLVPFFIVSLYAKRDGEIVRLNVRNRAHKKFQPNLNKYANLQKHTKDYSDEDYKGYKHSLCLNLDEFTQLILKPSLARKVRLTRKVPFPILDKYHRLLHDNKKNTVKRLLIANKNAPVETKFSMPAIVDTISDDPRNPFNGIIKTRDNVTDIYTTNLDPDKGDIQHIVVVVGRKKYILNKDGALIATVDTEDKHLKHVLGHQLVTYNKNESGTFTVNKWTLEQTNDLGIEYLVPEKTELVVTPYEGSLDYFGSVNGARHNFVSFGDSTMHVWRYDGTGTLKIRKFPANITFSNVERYVARLYNTRLKKTINLISWKYDKHIYAHGNVIRVQSATSSFQLLGHKKKVTCLDEEPGIIVTGSEDKNLIIWSSNEPQNIYNRSNVYYEKLYSYARDDSDSDEDIEKKQVESESGFGYVESIKQYVCTIQITKNGRKQKMKLSIDAGSTAGAKQMECTYRQKSNKQNARLVKIRLTASPHKHVLTGHTARVTTVICKTSVYSTSKDNTIRIWRSDGIATRVLTMGTLDLNPIISKEQWDIKIAVTKSNIFYAYGPFIGAYDTQTNKRKVFGKDNVRLDYIEGFSSDEESEVDEEKEEPDEEPEKTELEQFRETLVYVNTIASDGWDDDY